MKIEIQKIIEKSLPAEVGTILKERLEKAENDVVLLEEANKTIENLQKQKVKFEKRIADYQAFDTRNTELGAREEVVSELERNLKVSKLETQLEEANKRADIVKDFTSGLVRNTSFRKEVFSNEGHPSYTDQHGLIQYPPSTPSDTTETKTEE